MAARGRPVVCVSYLASAELWSVPDFPAANHGAEIQATELSIAADGPMAAAALAALGVPTLLIANDIGRDEVGSNVGSWLQQHGVSTTAVAGADIVTPRIVVVADGHHTRTWFAHLPGVTAGLGRVDLSAIATASFVYLDAYELIESAAVRTVRTARTARTSLLVNLGGTPLSEALRRELIGYERLLIQTNVDDSDHLRAPTLARDLVHETGAEWAVVTVGAVGAIAASRSRGLVAVPAFPVRVRHTHCAGAAFSGGLLYGLRAGLSIERSLQIGSASGALRCTRHQNAPFPTLLELESVVTSLDRSAAN